MLNLFLVEGDWGQGRAEPRDGDAAWGLVKLHGLYILKKKENHTNSESNRRTRGILVLFKYAAYIRSRFSDIKGAYSLCTFFCAI